MNTFLDKSYELDIPHKSDPIITFVVNVLFGVVIRNLTRILSLNHLPNEFVKCIIQKHPGVVQNVT